MAEMFLYNGVKLPAPPWDYSDDEPAAIFYSTVEDLYVFYCTDGGIYGPLPQFVAAGADIWFRSYTLTDDSWVFKNSNNGLSSAIVYGNDLLTSYQHMEPVWSSKDILASRNSTEVTFPASTPVPAYCLTFSSTEPFTLSVYNKTKNWDGTLYYSTDGNTWPEWDGTTTLSSAEIDGENKLFMRGSGNSVITGNESPETRWSLIGTDIRCDGDIETLLDYETVSNGIHPDMGRHSYQNMFYDCSSLMQAPELPATTLTDYCYMHMFRGCISLTQAPELPATTLAAACYWGMFYGCISLIEAPTLPATTLCSSCYRWMFRGCISLIQVPELPATALANYCYESMFYLCSGIKLSEAQTGKYRLPYRIPPTGSGITATGPLDSMFSSTGGTFTGTPEINTTYYLYDPNYQPELPKLDPATLMLGYLAGQKARALRNKLVNTPNI